MSKVAENKTALMQRNLKSIGFEVLVLLASAFIYSLAFPGFVTEKGLGFIAFFAIIPVLYVIKRTTWPRVGFYGFFFGFMFYTFFNYWLTTFHPLAIYIVTIIKGGEMVALFLALKCATKCFKKRAFYVEALIWVAYAFLSESWFAGYPYGTICYALYRYLPLIQIAEYTGIWFIIFMMILPQAFIANYLYDHRLSLKGCFKAFRWDIIIYIVAFIIWFITGCFQLSFWSKAEPDKIWRVATIQHNHDSWKGGLQTYKINFNNLRRLTLEALQEKPDAVLWSETAFVPSVAWHTNYHYKTTDKTYGNEETSVLVDQFIQFGKELPVPLVTGNPEGVLKDPTKGPILENGDFNRTYYNGVILFDNGEIAGKYRKQHLVPFTEHFPYEKSLPWLYNILLANDYNWWEKGEESVVFKTDEGVTFSTPICFEDVFGYLSANFVKAGANVIANMTNDNWSGAASAELQHCAIAVFRSVENRKSTIRGTNSGITCLIPPTGKIVDPMEPFKMGYHIYDVPVYETEHYGLTFFNTHIDLFAYIAIYSSIALLGFGCIYNIVKKYRGKKNAG